MNMSKLLPMGVFGFAALAGGHLVSAASPTVIDQSFISGDGAPLFSDINEGFEFVAQTFTAGVSGELDSIEIAIRTLEGATSRLNVAIRTAFNQIPTETVLGSITVDRNNTGIGNPIRFTQTIDIAQGEEYAIVVDYPDVPAGAGQSQGIWSGQSGNQYDGGTFSLSNDGIFWQPGGNGDLFFQTFVAIIEDHLVCYRIQRAEPNLEKQEVIVNNQFGEQRFKIGKPETLCVPSSKEVDQ